MSTDNIKVTQKPFKERSFSGYEIEVKNMRSGEKTSTVLTSTDEHELSATIEILKNKVR